MKLCSEVDNGTVIEQCFWIEQTILSKHMCGLNRHYYSSDGTVYVTKQWCVSQHMFCKFHYQSHEGIHSELQGQITLWLNLNTLCLRMLNVVFWNQSLFSWLLCTWNLIFLRQHIYDNKEVIHSTLQISLTPLLLGEYDFYTLTIFNFYVCIFN